MLEGLIDENRKRIVVCPRRKVEMFELSDEEDQNFWENLPFEKLDNSIGSKAIQTHQEKNHSVNRNVHWTEGHQQRTPITEDPRKKKAAKRKFPGPAGNLPQNMTNETMSPECVLAFPTIGKSETSNEREVEDPVTSQTCLEEAFSSRQWKRLLSDLGPDASSIVAKFSIKSMLFKANKKRLPRGKIPLILGYVERVDFQGRDGSIVIRDPSGKMNGSIHQELIKDPSTALQVGWVLILRQVSVISPSMRNHYLNITTGNIVAVYRLNKENEVTVTSCPSNGSPPMCLPSNSTSSCGPASSSHSLSWHKLVKESEDELTAARVQIPRVLTKVPSSFPALNQVRSSGTAFMSKPGPSSHIPGPSPLFTGSTATHRNNSLQPNAHFNPGYYSNTASPNLPNVNTDGFFDDDFPDDDDHEILSLCDVSAFDAQHTSGKGGNNSDKRDNQPPSACVPHSDAVLKPVNPASSKPNFSSNALQTLATTNSSANCDSVKRKSFSFKLTPSISSPSGQFQTGETNQGTKFSFQRIEKHHSVSKLSDTPTIGTNFKIHLGGDINSVAHTKENKTEMNNMFGHWNDDLSDELLSQLTEDF